LSLTPFEKLARAKPAITGVTGEARAPHAASQGDAALLVRGYLTFLREIAGWSPRPGGENLDLGAGAGRIAEAFTAAGCRMIASEHTPEGVLVIHETCPSLETALINVAEFRDPRAYDMIFSREIYPFTRINAYDEQKRVVSNIIDSLKPGGVFLLAGSDVCSPDCLDYDRLIAEMRTDPRLALVTGKHYEAVFKHCARAIRGPLSLRLISAALSPYILFKRLRRGFARIYLIAFVKK
jgi:SAM-dependent methyltransferase